MAQRGVSTGVNTWREHVRTRARNAALMAAASASRATPSTSYAVRAALQRERMRARRVQGQGATQLVLAAAGCAARASGMSISSGTAACEQHACWRRRVHAVTHAEASPACNTPHAAALPPLLLAARRSWAMAAPTPQCQLLTGSGEVSEQLDGFVAATQLPTWGLDYQARARGAAGRACAPPRARARALSALVAPNTLMRSLVAPRWWLSWARRAAARARC